MLHWREFVDALAYAGDIVLVCPTAKATSPENFAKISHDVLSEIIRLEPIVA